MSTTDDDAAVLWTSKQVAEVCLTTDAMVNRWRCENRGPKFLRLGRSIRYRKSDVMAWLDAHTVATSESA